MKRVLVFFMVVLWTGVAWAETLTLQPCNADTYLTTAYPTSNYGNNTTISIGAYSTGTTHGLLKFDFSSVEDGAVISSAILYVYVAGMGPSASSANGQTIKAYRVTQTAWTEYGATWNTCDGTTSWTTPGGDYTETEAGSVVIPTSPQFQWLEIDITNLVIHAQQNTSEIIHLLLKGIYDSTNWYISTRSRESSDTGNRIKLAITYTTGWSHTINTITSPGAVNTISNIKKINTIE